MHRRIPPGKAMVLLYCSNREGNTNHYESCSMSKQPVHYPSKYQRRQERREGKQRREQERLRAAHRRRIILAGIIIGAALVLAVLLYFTLGQSRSSQGQTAVNPTYPAVDTISCDQLEQTAFHVHAHLSVYIDGKAVSIPAGIGIASDNSCFYWLHTHTGDGVIHIEAPSGRAFTLGNFLDIWGDRFPQLGYPSQLDQSTGWQVYVNGKPYTGDFHSIPLQAHSLITLAYESPGVKPDTTFNWGDL